MKGTFHKIRNEEEGNVMILAFILLVILTIVRGLDVDCGCFGALSRRADLGLIAEDLLMLSMALSILFDRKPARS